MFMNELDIDSAVRRYDQNTVKGAAARILAAHVDAIAYHSDGWAHWKAPQKAASKLVALLYTATRSEAELADLLRRAITPLRSFYSKHPTIPRPAALTDLAPRKRALPRAPIAAPTYSIVNGQSILNPPDFTSTAPGLLKRVASKSVQKRIAVQQDRVMPQDLLSRPDALSYVLASDPEPAIIHYIVEVIADSSGKYCGNGLTFPTAELAADYAKDLFSRWTLVTSWRVVRVTTSKLHELARDPVNVDGLAA